MIRLTLRQMEYFDALAQSRHFGRAAELAGVTQPALSAQIAEMEERLGCRLFERGGRAVELTEEGRVLQPRIERILSDAREVESVARRGRLAMEGRFRLGIIPTVAPYLLPRLLPALREQFPSLALELREAVTQALLDEAVQGRLDAAIVALPVEQPALVTEALFEDRFFLAVPAVERGIVEAKLLGHAAPGGGRNTRRLLGQSGGWLPRQRMLTASQSHMSARMTKPAVKAGWR